jgi:2'-5' RNA ligase
MYVDPSGAGRINSYALVSYIPEPLAGFLDRLRRELVPNCFLSAHITILPPRQLCGTPEAAWNHVRSVAPHFAPFDVELTRVEVFPISDVIYVGVGAGVERLKEMHAVMNTSGLECREPFPYQPHVTLAQELKPDELDELIHVARKRWSELPHPNTFRIDKVVFVQNTRRNQWLDLGECSLGLDESRLVAELSDTLAG